MGIVAEIHKRLEQGICDPLGTLTASSICLSFCSCWVSFLCWSLFICFILLFIDYMFVLLLYGLNMGFAAPTLWVFGLEIYHLQLRLLSLRDEKGRIWMRLRFVRTADIGSAPTSLIRYAQRAISQTVRVCEKVSALLISLSSASKQSSFMSFKLYWNLTS